MRSRCVTTVVVALCTVLIVASTAMAQFPVRLDEPKMKNEKTVAQCAGEGDKFVFIYPSGIARAISTEEMQLTMVFNPRR